jgi:hypothetical protein
MKNGRLETALRVKERPAACRTAVKRSSFRRTPSRRTLQSNNYSDTMTTDPWRRTDRESGVFAAGDPIFEDDRRLQSARDVARAVEQQPRANAEGAIEERAIEERAIEESRERKGQAGQEEAPRLLQEALRSGPRRPWDVIRVKMIQTDRKIPWTRACALSFTVGWWKESVRVTGKSAGTRHCATVLHELDAERTVL